MKEKNNIEQFDNLFKQQLENASVQPPAGLFEAMSSSIGSGAAVAKVSLLTKLFMGAILVASTTLISYYATKDTEKLASKENEAIKITNLKSNQQFENTEIIVAKTELEGKSNREISPLMQTSKPEVSINKHSNCKALNDIPITSVEEQNSTDNYIFQTKNLDNYNQVTQGNTPKIDPEIIEQLEPAHVKTIDSSYIFIPNAVTPNGDGLNDEYLIDIKGEERVQIIIFDKNLTRLFETKNKSIAWKCTLPNGEIAPDGDYIVKVIYNFKNKDQQIKTIKLKLIK